MTKMTPLYDKVIILPQEAAQTMGALFLPEDARQRPPKGVVVAAGPGLKDQPTTVQVGDTVVYLPTSGYPLTVDEREYLVMRETEILTIIEAKQDAKD